MSRQIKLFYATDIHGSERCFRKFINAGAFYGAKLSYVSSENFGFIVSVTVLAMVVLGGMGNIPGAMIGSGRWASCSVPSWPPQLPSSAVMPSVWRAAAWLIGRRSSGSRSVA